MDGFQRSARPLLALLALPMLVACGGVADELMPNTEHGRLQLTVERAVDAPLDDVSELRFNTRLRFARRLLAGTLPAGVEVYVEATAAEFGLYRHGGGWITRGTLYLGHHGAPTDTFAVTSDDIDVLSAELVPHPADPQRRLAKLRTRQPGSVRLTVQAARLDERGQRIALVEDAIALTVSVRPGSPASPASPNRGAVQGRTDLRPAGGSCAAEHGLRMENTSPGVRAC